MTEVSTAKLITWQILGRKEVKKPWMRTMNFIWITTRRKSRTTTPLLTSKLINQLRRTTRRMKIWDNFMTNSFTLIKKLKTVPREKKMPKSHLTMTKLILNYSQQHNKWVWMKTESECSNSNSNSNAMKK